SLYCFVFFLDRCFSKEVIHHFTNGYCRILLSYIYSRQFLSECVLFDSQVSISKEILKVWGLVHFRNSPCGHPKGATSQLLECALLFGQQSTTFNFRHIHCFLHQYFYMDFYHNVSKTCDRSFSLPGESLCNPAGEIKN